MALLQIEDLHVIYETPRSTVYAVNGVSLKIEKGDFLGIIGESGCGKSTVANSIIYALPGNGKITGGKILFEEENILTLNKKRIQELRWNSISYIPQAAMNSLDPVYTIGYQMVETFRSHRRVKKDEALAKARELFHVVGIDPERLKNYPHQLSGGMKQRAIIAMSLLLDPTLIIADEPTTGLDVVVQKQILIQMKRLIQDLKKSLLIITHDIAIVQEMCNRIAIMYGGKVVEYGQTEMVFQKPFHPYTLGLTNAIPSIDGSSQSIISIPGYPPGLTKDLTSCPFYERCPFGQEKCVTSMPEMVLVSEGHYSLCHFTDRIDQDREKAKLPETWLKNRRVL